MTEFVEEDVSIAMEPYQLLIERALKHAGGSHTFTDVVDLVREGKMFFWPGEYSCLVTEFVQYPRQRLLHVFLAAGDMDEIKRMEPSLRTFAESVKCNAISLTGRRGWVRALADLGFKEGHTIVVKNL